MGDHRRRPHGRIALLAGLVLAAGGAAEAADTPPRLITLASGGLRATIAPTHGGELAGLQALRGGRWIQLLYRGDDFGPTKDWTGKAPILWPATGRNVLPAGDPEAGAAAWRWEGTAYPMTIHGFARDLPWSLGRLERGRRRSLAVLRLRDTPKTRAHYPFGFEFTTEYILAGDAITIRQTVHAARDNAGPMPFSIGNHLTFKLPLVPGGDVGAITFETPARAQVETDAAGTPTGRLRPASLSTPTPVSSLPVRTAISLTDYPSAAPWLRIRDPAGLDVMISHAQSRVPAGAPVMFNLWGDVRSGFFAPEPWLGKQDSLVRGDGLIELAPGEDFEWAITIRVDAVTGRTRP